MVVEQWSACEGTTDLPREVLMWSSWYHKDSRISYVSSVESVGLYCLAAQAIGSDPKKIKIDYLLDTSVLMDCLGI